MDLCIPERRVCLSHLALCWLEVKLKAQMCSVTSLSTMWMRALEVSGGNPAWSETNVWCSSQMQWAFHLSVCAHLPYSFVWIRFVLFFMLVGSLSFWALNKSGRLRCFPVPELKPVWRGSLVSGLGAGMAIRVFSWLPELLEAVRPQTGCLNTPSLYCSVWQDEEDSTYLWAIVGIKGNNHLRKVLYLTHSYLP